MDDNAQQTEEVNIDALLNYDRFWNFGPTEIDPTQCAFKRYKWYMYAHLPYPFPSKSPIERVTTIGQRSYKLTIDNNVELSFILGPKYATPPFPIAKLKSRDPVGSGKISISESDTKSLIVFEELAEHITAKDALKDDGVKVNDCFDILSEFLSLCQRQVPYLASWLIYPVSLAECALFYQAVSGYDEDKKGWSPCASIICIGQMHDISAPAFELGELDSPEHSSIVVPNELLAEGQMALVRGVPRQAVWNSYCAIELLANLVFKAKQTDFLVSLGNDRDQAEIQAEELRKTHRTDIKFLLHWGLKAACGRSLSDEQQNDYEEVCELRKLRHLAAHAGKPVSGGKGRKAYLLSCRVVRWLAEVGNLPVKPLNPSVDKLQLNSPAGTMLFDKVGVHFLATIPKDAMAYAAQEVAKLYKVSYVSPR
ncbi:MAG TPA: hypothetical protein VMJ32_07170 [Pirellulales bacterium]|nr:hypothetical protein [Pirellulales bacterium]